MHHEVREPLDLIDEIERTLHMATVPFTWPVGMGRSFHGVFDLQRDRMRVFRPGADRVGAPTFLAAYGAELNVVQEKWKLIRFHRLREHAGLVFQTHLDG